MKLEVFSFGRKYGVPEADLIWDVRCLENPFWVPELRGKSGLDEAVREYILGRSADYLGKLKELLQLHLKLAEARNCENLRLAIGCTGGRHRSVCVSELLAEYFREQGSEVELSHRDIDRGLERGGQDVLFRECKK